MIAHFFSTHKLGQNGIDQGTCYVSVEPYGQSAPNVAVAYGEGLFFAITVCPHVQDDKTVVWEGIAYDESVDKANEIAGTSIHPFDHVTVVIGEEGQIQEVRLGTRVCQPIPYALSHAALGERNVIHPQECS